MQVIPTVNELHAMGAGLTAAQLPLIAPGISNAQLDYIRAGIIPLLPPVVTPVPLWKSNFEESPLEGGFISQCKDPSRITLVPIARDGNTAVQLTTLPGDNGIAGSGEMERCDLILSQELTDGYEGHEAWWAHSVYAPQAAQLPTWQSYVLFDFHNTLSGPGQANFMLNHRRQINPVTGQEDVTKPGILQFSGYGGEVNGAGYYAADALLGPMQKNVWYDFLYHVRWSSGPDGFFDAYVNGVQKLWRRGPTLYAGQGVYLKLANYHNPVCDPYPACIGGKDHFASSIIHDRVRRGATRESVERLS